MKILSTILFISFSLLILNLFYQRIFDLHCRNLMMNNVIRLRAIDDISKKSVIAKTRVRTSFKCKSTIVRRKGNYHILGKTNLKRVVIKNEINLN